MIDRPSASILSSVSYILSASERTKLKRPIRTSDHPPTVPTNMDATSFRSKQAPFKDRYRADPSSALVTLKSSGSLDSTSITCKLSTGQALKTAGLHPMTGGDGLSGELCSGDMLLEALVACAGVTLKAVATATNMSIRSGTVLAEADLDFRGTLGVDMSVPVGLQAIRMTFELDTDEPQDKLDTLLKLTERYCVVLQTIAQKPQLSCTIAKVAK